MSVLFDAKRDADNLMDIWDDTELIAHFENTKKMAYDAATGKTPNTRTPPTSATGAGGCTWRVGDKCRAPYAADDLWYDAVVRELIDARRVRVEYEGYDGETAIVAVTDLLSQEPVDEMEESPLVDCSNLEALAKPAATTAATSSASTSTQPKSAAILAAAALQSPPPMPMAPPFPPEMLAHVRRPTDVADATSAAMNAWFISGYLTGYRQAMVDAGKQ